MLKFLVSEEGLSHSLERLEQILRHKCKYVIARAFAVWSLN